MLKDTSYHLMDVCKINCFIYFAAVFWKIAQKWIEVMTHYMNCLKILRRKEKSLPQNQEQIEFVLSKLKRYLIASRLQDIVQPCYEKSKAL